jgi:hypothetical protein
MLQSMLNNGLFADYCSQYQGSGHYFQWQLELSLGLERLIQEVLVLRDRCVPKNRHAYKKSCKSRPSFFNETVQFLCECKCVILQ